MAVFESQYKELGFYVKDELKTFRNGKYSTENKAEIEVLEKLADAKRIDEPKQKKAEVAPKPKPAPRKRTSAK